MIIHTNWNCFISQCFFKFSISLYTLLLYPGNLSSFPRAQLIEKRKEESTLWLKYIRPLIECLSYKNMDYVKSLNCHNKTWVTALLWAGFSMSSYREKLIFKNTILFPGEKVLWKRKSAFDKKEKGRIGIGNRMCMFSVLPREFPVWSYRIPWWISSP